jgi:hypothetical protein
MICAICGKPHDRYWFIYHSGVIRTNLCEKHRAHTTKYYETKDEALRALVESLL